MRRYRIGRGSARRRNGNGSGIVAIALTLIMAVAIGYFGTRYVVYPLFLQGKGGETTTRDQTSAVQDQGTAQDAGASAKEQGTIAEEQKTAMDSSAVSGAIAAPKADNVSPTTGIPEKVVEDTQDIKLLKGYALQYGIFSDKAAADSLVGTLAQKGANVYIYETATEYRVMGNAYESQDKAKLAAEVLKNCGTEVSVVEY